MTLVTGMTSKVMKTLKILDWPISKGSSPDTLYERDEALIVETLV